MTLSTEPFSLYIHIPYCISKCPYCDFNSHVVSVIPEKDYTDAVVRELDHYVIDSSWADRAVQSIFFGGGTPSTFKPASIEAILEHVSKRFHVQTNCEITLEANPGTVDRANFFGYRAAGVNRISVGIQSFQPRLLKFLGRVHSVGEGRTALDVVHQAGFENFSFDLIFANPGQTLQELEADLETALEFQPPHLSVYNLTFEEGTPFHHEHRSGRLQELTEDEEVAMAELIEDRFLTAGLNRYEISNYARPGCYSRHNVNYWQNGDYLGIGAGAHSYLCWANRPFCGKRWSNEKNPGRYIARIRDGGEAITDRENLNFMKSAGEFLFLGLRMTEGVSCQVFCSRFGASPEALYGKIEGWLEDELMEKKGGYLRLTKRGMMVANSIFVDFM